MWSPEFTAKWKTYGRTSAFTLRAVRNSYYYTVQKAKRQWWAAFLQDED